MTGNIARNVESDVRTCQTAQSAGQPADTEGAALTTSLFPPDESPEWDNINEFVASLGLSSDLKPGNPTVAVPFDGTTELPDSPLAMDGEVAKLQVQWDAFRKSSLSPQFQSIAGEFVNVETFWISMDSLLIEILSHDYLDWAWGGQSMVVIYMIERFLQSMWDKGGKFRLIWFDDLAPLYHLASPELGLMSEIARCHISSTASLQPLTMYFRHPYSAAFRDVINASPPSFVFSSSKVNTIGEVMSKKIAGRFEVCLAGAYVTYRSCGVPVAALDGILQGLSSVAVFYDPHSAGNDDEYDGLKRGLWKGWIGLKKSDVSSVGVLPICEPESTGPVDLWVSGLQQRIKPNQNKVEEEACVTYRSLMIAIISQQHVSADFRSQEIPDCPAKSDKLYRAFIQPLLKVISQQLADWRRRSCSTTSFVDLIDGRYLLAVSGICQKMKKASTTSLPKAIYEQFAQICSALQISPNPWTEAPLSLETAAASSGGICPSKQQRASGFSCSVECSLITSVKKNLPDTVQKIMDSNRSCEKGHSASAKKTVRPELFFDKYHWHSGLMIVDPIDVKKTTHEATGNPRFSQKGKQRQRVAVKAYGDSIKTSDSTLGIPNFAEPHCSFKRTVVKVPEGASNLLAAKRHGRAGKAAKGGKPKLSKKELIIQREQQGKEQQERTELAKWINGLEASLKDGTISIKKVAHEVDQRIRKSKYASSEIELLMKSIDLHRQCLKWDGSASMDINQRRRGSPELIVRIRYLLARYKDTLSGDQLEVIARIWKGMGFSFDVFMDMDESGAASNPAEDGTDLKMEWIEYMFSFGAELMEIQNDPKEDNRVSFVPDGWQRQLLDAVDADQSALVIAPTSAGKTFVSYYCIEKVLKMNQKIVKDSELGFVVYVSPTKALVNQVAATVYAHFAEFTSLSGCPVYGIFTRDYAINVNRCQVLITVPECLDILLMTPSRERWAAQLRYVILDEIHCIGGSYMEEDSTNVWEHIIKMFPCPFLALSATVGNPDDLFRWLNDVEERKIELGLRSSKGRDPIASSSQPAVRLVTYAERYSELHHYLFEPGSVSASRSNPEASPKDDESVGSSASFSGKLTRLHPLSVYSAKSLALNDFPKDQSLTSAETLKLFEVMAQADAEVRETLKLETFFKSNTWMTRADLRRYEAALKSKLINWARNENPVGKEKAKAKQVLVELGSATKDQLQRFMANFSTSLYAYQNVTRLIDALRSRNMLPCLAFGDNRRLCEALACRMLTDLAEREAAYLAKEDNARIVAKWQTGKDLLAKEKKKVRDKKVPASAASKRPDEEDEMADAGIDQFPLDLSKFNLRRPGLGSDLFEERRMIMVKKGDDFGPLIKCLERGIGFHHSGMTLSQRQTVEMLFRAGYLSVVFTTSTLALGIHMPCRTVMFTCDSMFLTPLKYRQMAGRAGRRGFDKSGNVILFSLPTRKITRLLTSSLPILRGNTPFTPGTLLRLLTLCDHAKDSETTLSRAKVLLNNHFITYSWSGKFSSSFERQMSMYVMFCAEFLEHLMLIDNQGRPSGLAGIVNHLSYHQPGCFVLVYFLQRGVFHEICNETADGHRSKEELMEMFVLVLSYLFTSMPIRKGHDFSHRQNSKVILEELPESFVDAIDDYNASVNDSYRNFIISLVESYEVEPTDRSLKLPISGCTWKNDGDRHPSKEEISDSAFYSKLAENSNLATFQGFPMSLCGNDSRHVDLGQQHIVPPVDQRVFCDSSFVPSIPYPRLDHTGQPILMNAYALDFHRHGIRQALVIDNGLMEGDVFHQLKDFSLVLKAIVEILKVVVGNPRDAVLRTFEELAEDYHGKFLKAFGLKPQY